MEVENDPIVEETSRVGDTPHSPLNHDYVFGVGVLMFLGRLGSFWGFCLMIFGKLAPKCALK